MSTHSAPPSASAADAATSIDEAVASSRLEGLEPTQDFLADAEELAEGDIEDDELVARAIARHRD